MARLFFFARLQARLLSPDFGKHLLEVEDLLQKHALLENDIALQAERVQGAGVAALQFADGDSKCRKKNTSSVKTKQKQTICFVLTKIKLSSCDMQKTYVDLIFKNSAKHLQFQTIFPLASPSEILQGSLSSPLCFIF